MTLCILYPGDDGKVVIMNPTGELSTMDSALKDVPAGRPFVLTNRALLPDPAFQSTWVVDFSEPDGIGLGYEGWLASQQPPAEDP